MQMIVRVNVHSAILKLHQDGFTLLLFPKDQIDRGERRKCGPADIF